MSASSLTPTFHNILFCTTHLYFSFCQISSPPRAMLCSDVIRHFSMSKFEFYDIGCLVLHMSARDYLQLPRRKRFSHGFLMTRILLSSDESITSYSSLPVSTLNITSSTKYRNPCDGLYSLSLAFSSSVNVVTIPTQSQSAVNSSRLS